MITFLLILLIACCIGALYLFFSLETKIVLLEDKVKTISRTQSGWITLTLDGQSRTLKYVSILDSESNEMKERK